MKYFLTLLALISLYNILIAPSEVIRRDNAKYMRKRASASSGEQVRQAHLIPTESDESLEARNGICPCAVYNNNDPTTNDPIGLVTCGLHNNIYTFAVNAE